MWTALFMIECYVVTTQTMALFHPIGKRIGTERNDGIVSAIIEPFPKSIVALLEIRVPLLLGGIVCPPPPSPFPSHFIAKYGVNMLAERVLVNSRKGSIDGCIDTACGVPH